MKILELFQDWEDVVEVPAGTVVFAERSQADVMYVILSGEIELTLHDEALAMESEGGIIGEIGDDQFHHAQRDRHDAHAG